jgi:UDP-N-acetylglucosamine--N-acetylmuramyl-(pentapeptide) pyrophosphoryl-undecaprenol N-acetylglucosamine transferase
MGGFAGVPVTLAAATKRLPLVLHEQNAHLSFAQRIPLRWATALAEGLPIEEDVQHRRIELVGNPVRSQIAALAGLDAPARSEARSRACARLGLDPSKRTVLVLGGSLGSGPLNELVPQISLPPAVQALHLAGEANVDATRRAWGNAPAIILGYVEDMHDAYVAADLAISRSGASVVAELAIAALPSILVPLTTLARGDQAANARVLERAGAAIVVPQATDRFVETLSAALTTVLADDERRSAMALGARSVAKPDAADRLADVVESVLASA